MEHKSGKRKRMCERAAEWAATGAGEPVGKGEGSRWGKGSETLRRDEKRGNWTWQTEKLRDCKSGK